MTTAAFWSPSQGRELDATPLAESPLPRRIVACVNVWNDLAALRSAMPTWLPFVDAVIAVDGMYHADGLSTDGTREFLQSNPKVQLIDTAGQSQCEKRSRYLDAGRDGDYLFIIDSDETVTHGDALRHLPVCDVGWVRVQSPLYAREYGQPRIIRWRPGLSYRHRHHWIYQDETVLCTHQYGGSGFSHRTVPITIHNRQQPTRSHARLAVQRTQRAAQSAIERTAVAGPRTAMSDASIGGREALQILNFAYRDDGIAPSRFHTAINRTTPHASLFFKSRPGPFAVPEQFLERTHGTQLTRAVQDADVLHFHVVMSKASRFGRAVPTVFHHHGSMLRANSDQYNAQAKERDALVLVSNLELLSWTDGIFLPNTVPVARYAALASQIRIPFTGAHLFRVAHSPSNPQRKGTAEFLSACKRLAASGVPIEPVLIHDCTHVQSLVLKASCHASFDSFWLGMQCSGIEAAAMGMPVIAGDQTVADRYVERFDTVPYTFANSQEELEVVLRRLVSDAWYRVTEQQRVHTYVTDYHDEAAVALAYLDHLDVAFAWRAQPSRPRVIPRRSNYRGVVR